MNQTKEDLKDFGLGCLLFIGGIIGTIWILETALTLLFGLME